jgi:hypothetical protein
MCSVSSVKERDRYELFLLWTVQMAVVVVYRPHERGYAVETCNLGIYFEDWFLQRNPIVVTGEV